jgi:hypothetical protein
MKIGSRIFAVIIFLVLFILVRLELKKLKDKPSTAPKALSKEDLKMSVKYMEDSITALYSNPKTAISIPSLTQIELINRLKLYYKNFPNDAYSAECLFKIHIKYMDLNALENSVAYGDTLLANFPNFQNRDFLLESMGSAYDSGIEPRDTAMVRRYYTLLLKEPTVAPETREGIIMRLKYIKMNFFEYVNFQSKKASNSKK